MPCRCFPPAAATPHRAFPSPPGQDGPAGTSTPPTRRLGVRACPPESHRSERRRRNSAVPHRWSSNHGRREEACQRWRRACLMHRGSMAPGGCLLASPPRRSACIRVWWSPVVSFWGLRSRGLRSPLVVMACSSVCLPVPVPPGSCSTRCLSTKANLQIWRAMASARPPCQ